MSEPSPDATPLTPEGVVDLCLQGGSWLAATKAAASAYAAAARQQWPADWAVRFTAAYQRAAGDTLVGPFSERLRVALFESE